MKSKFSEQDLKERAHELLYGLLDENEAEELRRLIASDATAARIFDEARETVDRFARAARWEETSEAEEDETTAKNVAVETAPFDGGAAFLFGSAFVGADAFSATVDAETPETGETNANEAGGDESSGSNRKRAKRRLNLLRKNKTAPKNSRSETGDDDGKREEEARKERRRAKSGKSTTFARTAQTARTAQSSTVFRFRFGSKGRVDAESGWATVGRTASGDGERRSTARRFWARVPKPTLFQNLIIALAVVALSTVVGFWAQESALQARFRDDFRIQIAAPRTLARGESQTIAATTTAPNGKPRRVPIRFSFSDAETGAPILAHTESGDASGVARFKIPDVSDFPTRTRLTISAGEQEKETFETILTVVDAPKANVGANAAARFAASEAVAESAVEVVTSEKRRAQKKAFAEALNKRNGGRSMAMSASLAPTGKMGTATGSPSASAPGTMAAPPISGFDAMGMGAPASPDGGMGTATGSISASPASVGGMSNQMGGMGAATGSMSASPDSDVAMSNKMSVTTGASPSSDVAMSAQMGGTGAPPSASSSSDVAMSNKASGTLSASPASVGGMRMMDAAAPPSASSSSDGETANKTDASPRFNFATDDPKLDVFLPSWAPMGTSASNDDWDAETPTAVADEAPSDDFNRAVAELESALKLADDGKDRSAFAATLDVAAPLDASEKRGLDVRFYPSGGRLVAGRENVVWFECVDGAGRPVVGEFALNDSEGRVATAKTSEGGVGSLRWTPDADETYSLETAFDGKTTKIVEIDKVDKIGKSGKNGENEKGGSVADKEKVAAEEPPTAELALNAAVEDFQSAPSFETFRFSAPTPTVERVAFAVASPVLESGASVELEIWVKNEFPLAATVEKNGVALAQRVWTAKKGRRRVVVPLDPNVSGAMNVSLWNCARTPIEKIGSATVYRKPAVAPTLSATLERDDAGNRALQIAVDPKKGFENAKSIRLKTFWAPTRDAALDALELDETLLYASDERRVEILGTLVLPPPAEPILFDNLLELKESALKKLNAFWLGEAGLAGRVVGLGFLGCGALAALTVFCVVFGALKARRGAVVVLFCAALATFFYFERRRIDFSETLSEAIAVSVDESKAAQRDANDGATGVDVPNDDAEKAASPSVRPAFLVRIDAFDATKPATGAEWSVPLTGNLATTDAGFVLVKIVADDGTRAWKAISLSESGEKETEGNR